MLKGLFDGLDGFEGCGGGGGWLFLEFEDEFLMVFLGLGFCENVGVGVGFFLI